MTQHKAQSGPAEVSGTTRFLRLVMIAVVVVPVALYAIAAYLNYQTVFRDAQERVVRAADAIDQHALKVFETDELIVDEIAARTDDMDWPEITRSADLHRLLVRLADKPEISMLGLIAPDNTIAATNREFPMPAIKASPRSFVTIERGDAGSLFLSDVTIGAYTGGPQFILARHKTDAAEHDVDGMIFVSTQAAGLAAYYKTIVDPADFSVTLARADGLVLVRYPEEQSTGKVLSTQSHFRQTIARSPERGTYATDSELDGVARLFAYDKVGMFPIYVAVGLTRSAVIGQWLRLMASHLIFGMPAMLALLALVFVALRSSQTADRAVAAAQLESERRQAAEDSLRHAQKLEAVGQMTGGVAHDFNNLLTAITGNLDMILRRPEDQARVRRLAESALRAAMRGERLTQQLLMFSRRQVMRPETFNVNRLLMEFEPLMRRAAGERIDLQLVLDAGVDPSRVDRAQFEAAVLNLVVNARDALSDGGVITIETHNVDLGDVTSGKDPEFVPGAYVMVAVSDNGTGIDKAVLPHVFEPFFTTKEVGRGSGLGLSQVYGFAKETGGQVQVYSEVGRGTAVKLYLPKSAERPADTTRRGLIPLRTADGGETVLVVEDDEGVLAMAIESLSDLGYRVLVAHNGQEALRIVDSPEKIDVLFSDVVMPGGLNGAQLAMETRRLRPDIKVLLTSGYTGAALAHEHGLPPDLPFLGKPYRRDQLAAQLRVIVGGQAR